MTSARNSVVVGFDGSADADRALDWAGAWAAAHHVPVLVLAANPSIPSGLPFWRAEEAGSSELTESVVADACRRVESHGATVSSQVVDAAPSPALLDASREARMVVIGARGHGVVGGLLLGSVSQHVSRHASCPVVVVREQADPRARRIVVGIDASPGSEQAIGFAFEAASVLEAPLVAVLGWRDTVGPRLGALEPRTRDSIADRIAAGERTISEALAGWPEKYPDVSVTREAVPEPPGRVLADASERAALVVVGSRGRGGFDGLLLGSTSQALLQHARCPVAVVR
jgi:nucleotide-binding universal stress UspA family protein